MLQRTRTDWVPARPMPHPTMEGYTVYSLTHPTSEEAPGITVVSSIPPERAMGTDAQSCTLLMPGDRHRRMVAEIRLCGEHFTQGMLLDSFDGVVRHPLGTPGVEAERPWPTIGSFAEMKKAADRVTPVPDTTLITYRPKQFDPAEMVSIRVGDGAALAVNGPDEVVESVFAHAKQWLELPRCVVYGAPSRDDDRIAVIAALKTFDGVPVEGIAEVVLEPRQLHKLLKPVRDRVHVVEWAGGPIADHQIAADEPPADALLPDATFFPTLIETNECLRDTKWWHEVTTYAFRTSTAAPTGTATPTA